MQELKATFHPDGRVQINTTKMSASVEEKMRLLESLAAELDGTISEENHNPEIIQEGVQIQG